MNMSFDDAGHLLINKQFHWCSLEYFHRVLEQYTVKLTNECTENSKIFVIDSETWSRIKVGETLCADNLDSW